MTTPLFPLPNLVLFPGLVLPLYIFEQRYRDLLARVRRSGEPFGMLRILEGDGSPLSARISTVGTLAHLTEVEDHEDGTASIIVVGGERFEVTRFDESESYLSADIREWPLPPADETITRALATHVLEGVVTQHPQDAAQIRERAPREPLMLATFALSLLPLSGEQREEALRAPTLEERLELLSSWLPARTLN